MARLYWWENYSPEIEEGTDSDSEVNPQPKPNGNITLTTKTLREIAQENKLKGKTAFDFQDIQDIIEKS